MATASASKDKGKKAAAKPQPDYRKALDRLNEQSSRKGGGDRDYMELTEGKNVVRVLPGHPDMEGFYEEVYYHRRQLNRKQSLTVICLNHGDTAAEDCPICEQLADLRKSKDKDDKKAYNEQRPKARFFMNCIDRKDNTLKILACGISIMKGILGYVTDEDYGDVLDPESGTDLIITRTGEGLDTEYDVKARRNSTPALDDEEALSKLIGTSSKNTGLNNLTELKTQFEGEPDKVALVWEEGWDALKDQEEDDKDSKKSAKDKKHSKPSSKKRQDDDEDEEEDDEEEEEEKPKAKAKAKSKPAPAKKSSKSRDEDEEDEDEDEEEEEDDDEDEEEEEKPSKSKAKSKPAPAKKSSKKSSDDDEDDDEEDLDDLDAVLNKHKSKGKK